ncbi:hypothetical protein NB717_001644 [Xanthomonas sacchari]|nr:hypothetical protein [Xanthomonas sacchari]
MAQQGLGAGLVEDGARVDLGADLEGDAGRDIGLDQAGDHVHRRALGGQDQVDAGGAGLLRQARDQLFDLLADDHHHVGEFVDEDDDERQRVQRPRRLGQVRVGLEQRVHQRLPGVLRVLDLLVEAGQVAHADRAHQLVAALHLRHAPAQAVGGLLHVGDHRRQQMRDALVDAQFEHLRVDHQHPQVLGRGLVQQAQHHRVDRHRLARAGGTGDQQVRHARQVGHGRTPGDVLAQGQGQRTGRLVVFLGAQQLAEIDHLAADVGDLQADHRLARDHVDHAHRLHRQAAGDVLVQRTDLADLDARRRFDLEAGDDRTRIGADHLRLDAEILELELDLPRQGFQGLLGIALGLRLGVVQQGQRRHPGRVAAGTVEQRDLLLALGPLALLHHRRRRRLDLDRLALGALHRVDLAHFLAFLAHGAGLLPFVGLLGAAPGQRRQGHHRLADALHHREPGQPGGQGHRHQQQYQHEQVGAERAEAGAQRIADQLAEDAAGAGHVAGEQAQVQQPGGGDQETDDADQAQRRAEIGLAVAVLVHAEQRDPGDRADHHRQQEGHVAEQLQQHVGDPGAELAAHVVHRRDHAAGMRPARIGRRVRGQAGQQVQQQRRDRDQRQIAPQLLPAWVGRGALLACRRIGALGFAAFRNLLRHAMTRP